MKRLVSALAAVSALAVAAPALAQPYGYDHGDGRYDRDRYDRYDNDDRYGRGDRYGPGDDYREQLRRLEFRIDRGARSGRLTRREADRLSWQVQEIRRLERSYWRNDGRLSGWERRDLNMRVDRLAYQVRREAWDDDRRY